MNQGDKEGQLLQSVIWKGDDFIESNRNSPILQYNIAKGQFANASCRCILGAPITISPTILYILRSATFL